MSTILVGICCFCKLTCLTLLGFDKKTKIIILGCKLKGKMKKIGGIQNRQFWVSDVAIDEISMWEVQVGL